MSEYGKDITVTPIRDGKPEPKFDLRERSLKAADKAELVKEMLVAIEPLINGETDRVELEIKDDASKQSRWTLVKKWKLR